MNKQELLDAAKKAVGDRGLNYGRPEDNFARIARRWQVHFKNRYDLDVTIDSADVAQMMADMKLARLENDPAHLDSWTDLAGYAACGADLFDDVHETAKHTADVNAAVKEFMTRARAKSFETAFEKAAKDAWSKPESGADLFDDATESDVDDDVRSTFSYFI